jgi:hypothetical protein
MPSVSVGKLVSICIVSLGLASCATPVQHNTASGKPEVTINVADLDAVTSTFQSEMINRGYMQTGGNRFMLKFDRPVTNILASALLGSRYDSQPNARITYMFSKFSSSIRVVADMAVITNPGSAFERRTPFNNNQDSLSIQQMMLNIKLMLERTYGTSNENVQPIYSAPLPRQPLIVAP